MGCSFGGWVVIAATGLSVVAAAMPTTAAGPAPLAEITSGAAPPSTAPVDARTELLDDYATMAEDFGFDVDRDCLGPLLDQLSDSDVEVLVDWFDGGMTDEPVMSDAADAIGEQIETCFVDDAGSESVVTAEPMATEDVCTGVPTDVVTMLVPDAVATDDGAFSGPFVESTPYGRAIGCHYQGSDSRLVTVSVVRDVIVDRFLGEVDGAVLDGVADGAWIRTFGDDPSSAAALAGSTLITVEAFPSGTATGEQLTAALQRLVAEYPCLGSFDPCVEYDAANPAPLPAAAPATPARLDDVCAAVPLEVVQLLVPTATTGEPASSIGTYGQSAGCKFAGAGEMEWVQVFVTRDALVDYWATDMVEHMSGTELDGIGDIAILGVGNYAGAAIGSTLIEISAWPPLDDDAMTAALRALVDAYPL